MIKCPICKGSGYIEDGTGYCGMCESVGYFPKIVASAIRYNGIVYTGRRHHNIIYEMVTKYLIRKPTIDNEQGFVDEKGNYLTRLEGAHLALTSGQIEKLSWPPNLYSEDLW